MDIINHFQVEILPGAAEILVQEAEDALRRIPEVISKALEAAGLNVVRIGKDANQLSPGIAQQPIPASGYPPSTFADADGFIDPASGAINIPSEVGDAVSSLNINVTRTVIHEEGHRFDQLAGTDTTTFSNTREFQSFLIDDYANNPNAFSQLYNSRYRDVLSQSANGVAARQELAADIFTAIILGESGAGLSLSDYRELFPSLVSRIADEMLKEHEPHKLPPLGGVANVNLAQQAIIIASQAYRHSGYDPLIVDLNGDGVHLTSLANGIQFDLQNTGFAQQTAWIAGDDGFLVFDPDNSPITNGSQLLGENTILPDGTIAKTGFDALAGLANEDTRTSGVLTAADPLYDQLRILKSDGTLLTLADAGIVSINLYHQNTLVTDQYGNQQLDIGSFTRSDGSTGFMGDYGLVHDTNLSIAANSIPVSPAVMSLPDIAGSGTVYSLQQAIMRDRTGNLQSLIEQFIAETDASARDTLMEQIMAAWAGAPNANTQPNIHITVVENFMGQTLIGVGPSVVGNSTGILIEASYQAFKESTWAQLMAQSHLSDLFEVLEVTINPTIGTAFIDLSELITVLQGDIQNNYESGKQELTDTYRALVAFGMDRNSNFADFYSAFSGDPELRFAMDTAGKHAYTGFNFLDTGNPNAYMDLSANTGGFNVFTGVGDVLFFDRGDGQINIYETKDSTLVFGSDIAFSDVVFENDSNFLKVRIKDSSDYIRVQFQFDDRNNRIEHFQFADGTRLSANDVLTLLSVQALENTDLDRRSVTIGETIYASGNDSIWGGSGGNILIGGTGTENLYAGTGGDTLFAGIGNTTMYGGSGNDTFVFAPGNGVATIIEPGNASPIKSDIVQIGSALSDVVIQESGNDLVIGFKSTNDVLTIQDELVHRAVKYIGFADGNFLSLENIQSGFITLNVAPDTPIFVAPDTGNIIQGAGNGTIYTGDGDDIVYGNGNSTIYLGAGTDTASAGPGTSSIHGGNGYATVLFNQGDGSQTLGLVGSNNRINFGEDISANDVLFAHDGADLVVSFTGSNDVITIKGQLASSSVSAFNFVGGTQLSWNEVFESIALIGSAPDGTIDDSASSNSVVIQGAGGTETILLGSGNDTVIIAQGDTTLESGSGSNTIVFSQGDGLLTISEPSSGSNSDTLVLGSGLNATNVSFSISGNDVLLTSGADQITLEDALLSGKKVSTIVFSDGTTLALSEIIASITPLSNSNDTIDISGNDYVIISGTNDVITAATGDNVIIDNGGNANITTGTGQNYVYAGPGNNTITTGSGATIIDFGTGNSVINSGSGSNVIHFDPGDGALEIIESSSPLAGASDVIVFGAGIEQSNITVRADGATLIIEDGIEGDIITIHDGMNPASAKKVHQFFFADGSNISLQELLASGVTVESTTNNDTVDREFSTANEQINVAGDNVIVNAGTGSDTIVVTGSNATINAGNGSNYITVAGGNNTINLGNGGNSVELTAGNDVIHAGYGRNTFYINQGGGQHRIIEPGDKGLGYKTDSIVFGEGLNRNDIYLVASGEAAADLEIHFNGSNDVVIIEGALALNGKR